MADSSLSIGANTGSALQARAASVTRNLQNQGDGSSVTKSAKEFEAVLLGRWLEDAQKTFASVPGSDPDKDADPGSDNFRSIGLQGVATSIANSGGIGIASMLVKYLNRTAAPIAPEDGTAQASNTAGPGKGAIGEH